MNAVGTRELGDRTINTNHVERERLYHRGRTKSVTSRRRKREYSSAVKLTYFAVTSTPRLQQ